MTITYDAETHGLKGQQELVARISKFRKMPVSVSHNIDLKKYIKHDPIRIRNFRFLVSDIKVYANGFDSTTEGYVSVEFANFFIPRLAVNQTYVIAVIDAEGKRRFPQSFSERQELTEYDLENHYFRIDRYISRKVLLNEPWELIPDDTLSLHIDLDIVVEPMVGRNKPSCIDSILESCIKLGPDRKTWVLPLDSKLGRKLCEESKYFECLLTTPLKVGDPRHKIIPLGEYKIYEGKEHEVDEWEYQHFMAIQKILFCTTVEFFFMDDVFRLYKTADKYDIPLVLDFCRNCLELSLTPETAPEFLEFAEEFHDDRLRKTAGKFHAADCRLPDETAFIVHSRITGMDYEWIFKKSNKYDEYGEWIGTEVFYKGSHDKVASDTYDFYR